MLPSQQMRDLSVMPPKIKLQEIQRIQYSMLKDLLEDHSETTMFKVILSFGHSKLPMMVVTNH